MSSRTKAWAMICLIVNFLASAFAVLVMGDAKSLGKVALLAKSDAQAIMVMAIFSLLATILVAFSIVRSREVPQRHG